MALMRRLGLRAGRSLADLGARLWHGTAGPDPAWWSDRGLRWLALVAAGSLWLLLALRNVVFLALFAISAACMWWWRRRRKPVELDTDDWY